MQLSVLDQSPTRFGVQPGEAIRESVALAEACERAGYARYWVSEHHNIDAVAGTAPEILVAAIAARTRRIRVGSAGVMLPHYASLKVAETFRVLDSLAPGRIDLGLGRAPGGDIATALALNPDAMGAGGRFATQVQEVIALLGGAALPVALPAGVGAGDARIVAQPRAAAADGAPGPEVWILGSSDWGAQAAALGLPYCFAWFFADGRGAETALGLYRSLFRPSARLARPHAAIAVTAFAAPTEDEAWFDHRSREASTLARESGVFEPLRDPATLDPDTLPAALRERLERRRAGAAVGTPERVLARLEAIAASVSADEVAVVTASHSPERRRRSYELLAGAAGLGGG